MDDLYIMPPDLQNLTGEQLLQRACELFYKNQELSSELEGLTFRNIELEHQLTQLKRMIFGSRSERFVPQTPDKQLKLLEVELEEKVEVRKEKITYERTKVTRKEKPVRQKLPSHLPRREIIIEPEGDTGSLKRIGEEVTEELEYEPGSLFVNRYIRPKYVDPHDEDKGILTAAMPLRPLEKCIAGPGLLAHVVIDKFADHLPVYRQVKRFEREGVHIASSTIGDWITGTCSLLSPLYEALRSKVLGSDYIQADETPIAVLDRSKKGKTHQGYQWIYHAPLEGLVLFDYRPGRSRDGPKELLGQFQGYLQTDGYSAYEYFDSRPGIKHAACMTHARRYFEQALDNDPHRAQHVLEQIQKLYAVERRGKEQAIEAEKLYAIRQDESVPILKELGAWMKENYMQTLPKSAIGKALAYSISRWDKL